MKNGKIGILLMTTLFLLFIVIVGFMEPAMVPNPEMNIPLSFTAALGGKRERITCWEDPSGELFVFLPSGAVLSDLEISVEKDAQLTLNQKALESGMDCGDIQMNIPYPLIHIQEGIPTEHTLTFMQSSALASIHLDVQSGSMNIIHEKKGNQESGRMRLYLPDGELAYIGNLESLNGRGNDWLIPKKSYSLQLTSGADLLGMGQAEKWILQANAFDASHLRNKLVYDFSEALGLDFSPESQWVDLYLNGEYAGLYLLCERNEIHEQRVRLEGNENYLVSMDLQWRLAENKKPFVITEAGYAFRIHDSQLNDSDLRQRLQSAENAICAEDGRDPLTGKHWSQLIDLDSWARKYLVEEIFGNGDGGVISQYFYGITKELPMYAGPVWDYDISMGNSQGRCGGETRALFVGRPRIRPNISVSWYYELYQKQAFYDRMTELYREECLPLLDRFLNEQLNEYQSRITASSAMNQIRWKSLAASQTSVPDETEYIRSFMERRISFLNQLWLEKKPFHWVLIDTNDGRDMICYAVFPGERIPLLPEYEDAWDILGWYDAATEQPFDGAQPIYEDTVVYLKKLQGEEDTISLLQMVPIVVGLGILLSMILTDRKYLQANRKKAGKSITKQDVV